MYRYICTQRPAGGGKGPSLQDRATTPTSTTSSSASPPRAALPAHVKNTHETVLCQLRVQHRELLAPKAATRTIPQQPTTIPWPHPMVASSALHAAIMYLSVPWDAVVTRLKYFQFTRPKLFPVSRWQRHPPQLERCSVPVWRQQTQSRSTRSSRRLLVCLYSTFVFVCVIFIVLSTSAARSHSLAKEHQVGRERARAAMLA